MAPLLALHDAHPRVRAATTTSARPARRPASLQLVAIAWLFRLVVPCWPVPDQARGTPPGGRPTAVSRFKPAARSRDRPRSYTPEWSEQRSRAA